MTLILDLTLAPEEVQWRGQEVRAGYQAHYLIEGQRYREPEPDQDWEF